MQVHTNTSAKNAADFALAFWAGLLHTRIAIHVPFLIISRDKGYEDDLIDLIVNLFILFFFNQRLRNVLYQLRCFGRYATVVASGLVEYLKNADLLTKAVKDTFAELLHEPTNVAPQDESKAAGGCETKSTPPHAHAQKTAKPPAILPGGIDVENSAVMVLDRLLKTPATQRPKNAKALARFVSSSARVPEALAGLVMYEQRIGESERNVLTEIYSF